jgi:predicted ATPase
LKDVSETEPKARREYIRKISRALKVAAPPIRGVSFGQDYEGNPHLYAVHPNAKADYLTEHQLSDGTLRLFGLLWALLDGVGPVLFEEPEQSLHPALISYIPGFMASVGGKTSRQVMVSTHSPDMLRDEGIAMEEVLLLRPSERGTEVKLASEYSQIEALLEGGLNMADAVFPYTAPKETTRLASFGG